YPGNQGNTQVPGCAVGAAESRLGTVAIHAPRYRCHLPQPGNIVTPSIIACRVRAYNPGYSLEDRTPGDVAAWVCRVQGVIKRVAVPIVALAVRGRLDIGVSLHKPGKPRIKDPAIHVDQAHVIQHFMAGVAALGNGLNEVC